MNRPEAERQIDPARQRKARIALIALAALFVLPFAAAAVLHLSGWKPSDTRNHGEMLQPLLDLRDLSLERADGSAYAWQPYDRVWQIAVVPTPDCAQACVDLVDGLDKVWQLQGRRADRLNVLWFGTLPADAKRFRTLVEMAPNAGLAARLTGLATQGRPNAYLIDPNGYVVLRYAQDFDVAHLREDVTRMLK